MPSGIHPSTIAVYDYSLIAGNRVITLGTAIEQHFLVTQDWGMGSALAIFLVIAMGLTILLTENGKRVK